MSDMVWDDKQMEAIHACCDVSKRIVAVTGKAGTGKTSLMREIAKRLSGYGYDVQASAPTGKAAKRINEATGLPAMTNHRMLGYGTPLEYEEKNEKTGRTKMVRLSTGPTFRRQHPMPHDTVLADEYAMVNREIHRAIIDALKAGARVCMFGDVNQLRPIEEDVRYKDANSAFQVALIKFNGIVLDTIHRQEEGSGIASNGANILQGKMPKRFDDFAIEVTDKPVDALMQFVEQAINSGIRYDTTDHQIITAMNKSWIGTKRLNLMVQARYWQRERPFIELPRWHYDDGGPIRVQEGSKVVFTSNVYDLGNSESVFNGELGVVESIDFDSGEVTIDFGDRCVTIPPIVVQIKNGRTAEFDPRKSIDHAYVLTTHKSQGSEYQHVCYILNKSTSFAQSRRNLYTGITRARKHCTIITDMHSISKSTRFMG
jgi:exodeoxyribonuclease V alpha subunit